MRLSVRARWIIGAVAIAIGSTYGWLTTPHLDPARFGVTVDRYEIASSNVEGPQDQIAVHTEEGENGMVVLLHGRGSSPEKMLSDEMFEALDDLGSEAPLVVLPSGGESSYWHDREGGAWATYVLDDVIPEAIRRYQVESRRVAIGGISMGGFGAVSLALDEPDRFCGVGGHSPAVFASWEDSASGAFDDADDFEHHDLLARAPTSEISSSVWIDVGEDDPFLQTATDLAGSLEEAGTDVTLSVAPGGHDEDYWWARMDDYLGFYSARLIDC